MNNLITAVLTGTISILLFIYVSFTMREKGPILSNTFLLTPKEDWDQIDKKAEYRMVSVVFGIAAVMFLFLMVYILTLWKICLYIVFGLAVCDVVYAIVNSVKK